MTRLQRIVQCITIANFMLNVLTFCNLKPSFAKQFIHADRPFSIQILRDHHSKQP